MSRNLICAVVVVCALSVGACDASEGGGAPAGAETGDPTGDAEGEGSGGDPSEDPGGASSGDPSGDPGTSGDPTDGETSDAGESGEPSNCEGIVGEGFAVGQVAENWTLMDGNGQPVELHDYCGKVVFIEIGSEW